MISFPIPKCFNSYIIFKKKREKLTDTEENLLTLVTGIAVDTKRAHANRMSFCQHYLLVVILTTPARRFFG